MSAFPWDFDYETLITDEDRELRELVLAHYSEDAVGWILKKYYAESSLWPEYKRKVLKLIARNLPEKEFVKGAETLGQKYLILI